MEVHHHPNIKQKKFKEFILEGLMIFIAVMLGFFAESLREHLSDQSKGKEYINSLKQDLIQDTVNIHTWINGFNQRINEYDSLIHLLKQVDSVKDWAQLYWMARISIRGTVFDDNNNTLAQLKTSGNFRLISNKKIAEKIIQYEKDIENYKNVNTYDTYESRALYEPQSKLFDAFVFNDMSRPVTDSTGSLITGYRNVLGKPKGSPQLLSKDKILINQFVYYLHQRRSTFTVEIMLLYKQKEDAVQLINLIHNEFEL